MTNPTRPPAVPQGVDDDLENTVVLIAEKFSTLRLTTPLEDCATAIEPYVKAYAKVQTAERDSLIGEFVKIVEKYVAMHKKAFYLLGVEYIPTDADEILSKARALTGLKGE